jgi:hypothetical protein
MMAKFDTSALTFPLLEGHTLVSDALNQVKLHSIDAVISTDGKKFWLHSKSDLANADPATPLGEIESQALRKLSTADVAGLGFDLTHLKESQVKKYFPSPDDGLVVTSIINNAAGERMVVALANPKGMFKVVSKVWVCPEGGEEYRAPGRCRVHDVALKPG